MTKHTPGPWIVDFDNADHRSGGQWYIAGPAIVRFPYGATTKESEEAEANARLISAAPDLLEACEAVLSQLESEYMPSDESGAAIVKARAAIAKAKGEPK